MQSYEEVLERIDDKKTYCHKEVMDELRVLKTDLAERAPITGQLADWSAMVR